MAIQEQAKAKLADSPNKWEEESITEDYQMESYVFNFDDIRNSDCFGIKRYTDAIYRGMLQKGKRNGFGAMYYRKNRIYEGEVKHSPNSEAISLGFLPS